MKRRYFIDMDGTIAKWEYVPFERLFEQGYFKNLKPQTQVIDGVRELCLQGDDVYILSCYLSDSKYAMPEKIEWLKEYVPFIAPEKYILVPYGDSKVQHIPGGISAGDYLIDDYTKNLLEWQKAGGTGIKLLNGINHSRGTWQGFKISMDEFSLLPSLLKTDKALNEKPSDFRFINIVEEIDEAISKGLLQRDPERDNNILVYRTDDKDNPEGWYSQNILDVASELFHNPKNYEEFKEAIANSGELVLEDDFDIEK